MNETELTLLLTRMGSSKFKKSADMNLTCSCPFARWNHSDGNDSKNSFSIHLGGKNLWKCFACNLKGSLKGLVYKYQEFSGQDLGVFKDEKNMSFEEKFRSRKPDFRLVRALDLRADKFYKEIQKKIFEFGKFEFATKIVPTYAINRGVTLEQVKKWKLGFFTKNQTMFIPSFNKERMVGYTTRPIAPKEDEEKYKHAYGFKKENHLYGEQFIDLEKPIAFISEGFFDVWSMDRAGLPNCLGTMGISCSEEQAKILSQFKIVVIFPHDDKPDKHGKIAGVEMVNSFKEMLTSRGVFVLVAPFIKGKKDVGDWTVDEIKATVAQLLENI